MSNVNVQYKVKTTTEEEIYLHLRECNENFIPPLSNNIDIQQYSKKIFDKAVTFEAWVDHVLIGLVAVYFNDLAHCSGYITNVSIEKKFMGLGIASELIKECIRYAIQYKFKEIRLEVNKNNDSAIRLYKKYGFVYCGKKDTSITMKLTCL